MAGTGLSQAAAGDGLFAQPRWLNGLLLALLLVGGAAFRLYDLDDPPLDFHPTRQVRSLIIARGMYLQNLPDVPESQREFAVRQWRAQDIIEPPIMEALASFTYKWIGEEVVWVGRLYSVFFWLLGGLGLYRLARRLMNPDSALFALMLYLGWQYAVLASRSFQPDPLMTAAIIWALWSAAVWHARQNWGTAILAGLLAGVALLVKWTAVFFVAGGWLGLLLAGGNLRRMVSNRQVWVIAGLAALPGLLYALYSALA
ncbi:MAG: ArnT family glycosyltransferase, partial [Bellilinea sp.]